MPCSSACSRCADMRYSGSLAADVLAIGLLVVGRECRRRTVPRSKVKTDKTRREVLIGEAKRRQMNKGSHSPLFCR